MLPWCFLLGLSLVLDTETLFSLLKCYANLSVQLLQVSIFCELLYMKNSNMIYIPFYLLIKLAVHNQ